MFSQNNGSKVVLWSTLVIGLLFLAGCLIIQPVSPEGQTAAPAAAVESPEEPAAKPMPLPIALPDDVSDRQALAEHQARLGDLTAPAAAADSAPVADRQALAEHQATLADQIQLVPTHPVDPIPSLPERITNHQDLAEYQFRLGGGQAH